LSVIDATASGNAALRRSIAAMGRQEVRAGAGAPIVGDRSQRQRAWGGTRLLQQSLVVKS
jgi:hypothetical protein